MGFIKALIGLPVLIVILVFAFFNNELATFNLLPFDFEITVPLSVAILFFIISGFLLGSFFAWLSYAPLRQDLRRQKKKNKKLSKERQMLTEKYSDLQVDLEQIKAQKEALMPEKPKWYDFLKKPSTASDTNAKDEVF